MTIDDSPIAKLVNLILLDAINRDAWEIRVEPLADQLRVQLVIGVTVTHAMEPPIHLGPQIAARLKEMADLDVAETSRPQSGRFQIRIDGRDGQFDFGLFVAPTAFGEKVTLRRIEQ